ncbi:MAG: hypothetical protein H6Q69_3075, partial [Firmicutes bacterium]|nr:hypothetical protein [Bacillota bacterium]
MNLLTYYLKKGTIDSVSRGVAQFGRALPWGGRGREFESRRSDQQSTVNSRVRRNASPLFM